MSPIFQVVGLPRCGSALVATMFNLAAGCLCYHDLAATDLNWKETLKQARLENEIVGDVSTYGFMPKAVIKGARKVFIDKPWQESREAAEKAFGYETSRESYCWLGSMAQEWSYRWNPLVIPSAQLFTLEKLKTIWNHCMDGFAPFPERKVELLLGMDVQRRNPEIVFRPEAMAGREKEFI